MTTAAIIGAGDLGGAIAHALATRESVDRILIADAAEPVARGKALDLLQSGAITGSHTRLEGTGDFTRVAGCSVCIVADRFGHPPIEWHGDEDLSQLAALSHILGDAPVVFAGATQAELLSKAVSEQGFPRERLMGSCPEALESAVRSIVAMEANCAPVEVMLSVLGTPPDGFVIAWSEASIGGHALERVLTPVQLTRLEARTRRLWPPSTYALGFAAALVAEGTVRSARRAFSVLTMLEGEFEVRGRVGAVPAFLSTTGIVDRRVPTLSTRERVQLETALEASSRDRIA